MYKNLNSAIVLGIDGYLINVEIDISNGLPGLTIVGLPDTATNESRERVRSAIKNSGFTFPLKKITVNLAPAGIKKEHGFFDLAIAIGILITSGQLNDKVDYNKYLIAGELSLNGNILPLRGILPITSMCRENGMKLIAPLQNISEIKIIKNIEYRVFANLSDTVKYFNEGIYIEDSAYDDKNTAQNSNAGIFLQSAVDFSEIAGQIHAKRALEIAAAGGHAIMMRGAPGSGKTMLANGLSSILPEMTFEESVEVSKIYSIAGLLSNNNLIKQRVFRAPHHTISEAAMIGGSKIPRPGEVSLAHNGVLFLDEFNEYKKAVLESLRQPLSNGFVTISRAQATYTFPARFMLVAACNPCPCGYSGDSKVACQCSANSIKNYQAKVSGPILDRIDLQLEVTRVNIKDAIYNHKCDTSATIAERVKKARSIQLKRFSYCEKSNNNPKQLILNNANMNQNHIKEYCSITSEMENILEKAVEKFNLSMRAYYKILKTARTIADLAGQKDIYKEALFEAIQYRTGFER